MAVTYEEILELFRETDRQFQETSRLLKEQSRETDRKFQETDRKFQETDRRFQETDRRFQETDRKFQETDRLFKEQSRQTDARIAAASKAIAELGGRLGDFVESAVRPAAVRLFRERGIAVHEVHQDVSAQRGDEGIEVDLLVVNDTDVVGIECKSRLSVEDVDEHLERLEKLKRLLPSYAGKRLLGAIAAMVIPDDVAKYAYRRGLFVIAQTGEHLTIRNDARFQPRSW